VSDSGVHGAEINSDDASHSAHKSHCSRSALHVDRAANVDGRHESQGVHTRFPVLVHGATSNSAAPHSWQLSQMASLVAVDNVPAKTSFAGSHCVMSEQRRSVVNVGASSSNCCALQTTTSEQMLPF